GMAGIGVWPATESASASADAAVSAYDSDLAKVPQDAGMDELRPRRGGDRVPRGRLTPLGQAPGERRLAAVERAGQAIRDVLGEGRPREDHAPGAPRAEGDGLAPEVGGRAVRAIGPDDEHARRRVHREEDLQVGRRPADAGEGLVDDLALDEGDVELPRLEEWHVLRAAF